MKCVLVSGIELFSAFFKGCPVVCEVQLFFFTIDSQVTAHTLYSPNRLFSMSLNGAASVKNQTISATSWTFLCQRSWFLFQHYSFRFTKTLSCVCLFFFNFSLSHGFLCTLISVLDVPLIWKFYYKNIWLSFNTYWTWWDWLFKTTDIYVWCMYVYCWTWL